MKIAVVLAVYDGEAFLDAQLQSLADQDIEAGIDLWCADDGSADGSRRILEGWRSLWTRGAFHVLDGPRKGFAENFRSLIANPSIEADFYAFCDQDDVWDTDKLRRAVETLESLPGDSPRLYGGRTRLVDETGRVVGLSPLFPRAPGFGNALVQNIASGNTMVMDAAAWTLLRESAGRTSFAFHDWWAYLLTSGAGGQVVYDPRPAIAYRQHGGNTIGNRMSTLSRLSRLAHLLRGRNAAWHTRNVEALEACRDLLDEAALARLDAFRTLRAQPSPKAFASAWKAGIRRQSPAQNLTLWLAASIGKL